MEEPEWKQRLDPNIAEKALRYSYGDDRRDWQPDFKQYAYFIATHPNYEGIPHALDDDGKVMWNAPSNRKKGSRFWDLHQKRRRWWRQKAEEIGINTETNGDWISDTAKQIHPTNEKVCQTCGQTRDIRYVYLNGHSIRKFNKKLAEGEQIEKADLLTIFDAVDHLVDNLGEEGYELIESCFEELKDVERTQSRFKGELESIIEAQEPHWTSPGAMANPPDRLDGFHSYAICCRSTEDTGRHRENLSMYNADRRAYEQWADGNWSAANKLMNSVGHGRCPGCGNTKSLTADHIGPISIGFKHMPIFQPLCQPCNSGRNRYWNPADIAKLIEYEKNGQEVASRHIQYLWDECKHSVSTNKEARILSNLLRSNQHYYLVKLNELRKREVYDLLMCFLEPEHSDYTYEFEGLNPETLKYDRIIQKERADTFAESRGARMVRIAMDALPEYASKTNRDTTKVTTPATKEAWQSVLDTLGHLPPGNETFRQELAEAFVYDADNRREQLLRAAFEDSYKPPIIPDSAIDAFYGYTDAVGHALVEQFDRKINR